MKVRIKKIATSTAAILMALILLSATAFAAPGGTPPGDPPDGGMGGGPGGAPGSSASVSYTGASEISDSQTLADTSYSSTNSAENALLVSGGESTLTNPTVTKSGDTSDENSDFYGTNAAILVYNDATLNITGGTVTTDGGHANGVFAYGTGTINISNTTINTNANNSGGIMVTGGGTLHASNLTVETQGNSSAAIRSDRGGGTLTVDGGSYTTNGQGSPAIYSTADITVSNAALTATASEGVVVEGANSVTLNNTLLTDTNNTLNGQSTTYKNIFLYQSQSGDAAEGTSYFTASDSSIVTNQGDTFYITNTNSVITLTNNAIVNNDNSGVFLRAEAAAWGSSGSNGGQVQLALVNQTAEGDIAIDSISTLVMTLTNGSIYKGAIDSADQAKNVTLTLDESSVVILTGDSYVDSLENAVADNSNIYLNGYKLYVNGKAVSANDGEAPAVDTPEVTVPDGSTTASSADSTESDESFPFGWIIVGVLAVAAVAGGVCFVVMNKKK